MKNNCIIILYPAYFLSFSISLCSLKIILFLLIGCLGSVADYLSILQE